MTAAAGDEKARTAEELFRRYPAGSNGQTGDRYTVLSTVFPAKELDHELGDAAARMKELRVTADDLWTASGRACSRRSATCSRDSPRWRR